MVSLGPAPALLRSLRGWWAPRAAAPTHGTPAATTAKSCDEDFTGKKDPGGGEFCLQPNFLPLQPDFSQARAQLSSEIFSLKNLRNAI